MDRTQDGVASERSEDVGVQDLAEYVEAQVRAGETGPITWTAPGGQIAVFEALSSPRTRHGGDLFDNPLARVSRQGDAQGHWLEQLGSWERVWAWLTGMSQDEPQRRLEAAQTCQRDLDAARAEVEVQRVRRDDAVLAASGAGATAYAITARLRRDLAGTTAESTIGRIIAAGQIPSMRAMTDVEVDIYLAAVVTRQKALDRATSTAERAERARDAAVALALSAGISGYRIAQTLNLAKSSVRKIRERWERSEHVRRTGRAL